MIFKKLNKDDFEVVVEFAKNNMNVSETSRYLFMHRNTVVYRLERIKNDTGLNPLNFFELVQLLQLSGTLTIQCDYFKKEEVKQNEQTTEL